MLAQQPASAQRLAFADYLFHGFDAPERTLKATTKECFHVPSGLPEIEVVRDAIYVPLHSRDGSTTGGLFHADGTPIDGAAVRRAGRTIFGQRLDGSLPSPRQTLQEPLLYLGTVNGHFGHFLVESLARAWAKMRSDLPSHSIMHRLGSMSVMERPFVRTCLAGLGVTPETNVMPSRPVRLREVHVAHPALGLYEHVYRDLRASFHQIGERAGIDDAPQTEQPLYLSRAALSDSLRRTIGERDFEQTLASNGFKIFRPEQHDLATQIRVVHAHKYIFGFWGSAFRLAYFSPRKKLTCHFSSEFPTPSFLLDRAITDAEAWFVKASGACRIESKRDDYFGLHRMYSSPTLDFLAERGFVSKGIPAPPEPSPTEIARESCYIDARARITAAGSSEPDLTDLHERFEHEAERRSAELGCMIALQEHRLDQQDTVDSDAISRLTPHRDSWRAQRVVGRALLRAGDRSGGLSALECASRENPDSVTMVAELAAEQEPKDAIQTLEQALACLPGEHSLRAALVQRLISDGDTDAAIRTQRQGVEHGPDLIQARVELAKLLQRLDQHDLALAELRTAVSLDSDHAAALQSMIPALLSAGEATEALPHVHRLRQLRPANPEPLRMLATTTRMLRHWREHIHVRSQMLARKVRYAFGFPVR
jgi:tetratricopeptide (TPR) repeat protein